MQWFAFDGFDKEFISACSLADESVEVRYWQMSECMNCSRVAVSGN